jgi:hypothetical protein
MDARLKANPDLQLLLQLEPAHRVFLRNLTDALFRRSVAAVPTNTKPAPFWNDVFVQSTLPWGAFMESMLWHLAVVSVLWTVSLTWVKQEQIQQRRMSENSSLTYYPPPKTFPALGGRGPRVREHSKPQREASKSALRVARERDHSPLRPPDLKLANSRRPDVMASNPSSAMPLFAPKLREFTVPAGPATALAPATNIGQATTRRLSLPQTSAVAPTANVGSLSARRAIATPSAAIVAPAPGLQASTSHQPSVSIGNPQVVAPSPGLTVHDRNGIPQSLSASLLRPTVVIPPAPAIGSGIPGSGRVNSRVDLSVVPPAPSVSGAGNSAGRKRSSSLSAGTGVVSPAPSMRAGGVGRASLQPSGGTQAVPPPPSVGSGTSIGAMRVASLSGAGPHVIPPPASIGVPTSSAGGKGSTLSGVNERAVPPPPSLDGGGNSAGSRQVASLAGGNQEVTPPPAPVADPGHSAASTPAAMESKAVPPAPAMDKSSEPATIELPVRVIGMALSLPNSSYFSNYEVFIAERRVKKGDPELIKLVYESLPYQPRLAEYGLDNSKVYKLRVTRDPTCDETLLQMTWPQTDEKHSGSKYATGPPALAPDDQNSLLPCYRTTADDYRIAVTRDR